MNRAAQKLRIFWADSDYGEFLSLLRTFSDRTGLKVAAYCIMPNHYHVLAQGSGEQLTACFHEVDRLWALSYNERWEGRGHVFQGPFLSFPQMTAGWVVHASGYIHLNPVGRFVKRPEDYMWSSCKTYLGLRNDEEWIDAGGVLQVLGQDVSRARAAYRRYLEARAALDAPSRELSEEQCVFRAAAVELAGNAAPLAKNLLISEEEARRLAAHYGRSVLGLPVKLMSRAFNYRSTTVLSSHLQRIRMRMSREPGFQALVSKAVDFLNAPPWST